MVENRNIVTCIILSIVTCGIYGIYWWVKLNDEANAAMGDNEAQSGIMVWLISWVTCNIYGIFWAFKMGEKVDNYYASKGMEAGNKKIIYLVLHLCLGCIGSCAMLQNDMNNLA